MLWWSTVVLFAPAAGLHSVSPFCVRPVVPCFTRCRASLDAQAQHESVWVSAEEKYQKEFGRDVEAMHETGELEWLSRGSGSFGTVHRPVPSQPWRPMRMRLTGTGSLLPEIQVEVAHQKNLGQTLAVSPSSHGKTLRAGGGDRSEAVLKEMIKQQRAYRRNVEKRVAKLEEVITTGGVTDGLSVSTSTSVLGSPLSSKGFESPTALLKSPPRVGSGLRKHGELVMAAPFSPIVSSRGQS